MGTAVNCVLGPDLLLMSCYLEGGVDEHPLSALTVAAVADIGHRVDLAAAEPYQLPPTLGDLSSDVVRRSVRMDGTKVPPGSVEA
jgi:hypothetical protein